MRASDNLTTPPPNHPIFFLPLLLHIKIATVITCRSPLRRNTDWGHVQLRLGLNSEAEQQKKVSEHVRAVQNPSTPPDEHYRPVKFIYPCSYCCCCPPNLAIMIVDCRVLSLCLPRNNIIQVCVIAYETRVKLDLGLAGHMCCRRSFSPTWITLPTCSNDRVIIVHYKRHYHRLRR